MSQAVDQQRTELIEQTLPLVRHVMYQATAHFPRHVDKEELVRAGVLGLVEAAHRFDPDKGVAFPAFASGRIRGAILDAVRKVDWAPRSLRRAGRSVDSTTERLTTDLHRAPTTAEVAAALGMTTGELAELQGRLAQSVILGLDGIVGETAADGDDDVVLEGTVSDDPQSVEDELCDRELSSYLRAGVELLPDRHRLIIQGYFFDGHSSEELAGELGITVSRVSQIRIEAFDMLRRGLNAQYSDGAAPEGVEAASRQILQRRGAYAAAIAAHNTWRSRLEVAPPVPSGSNGPAETEVQPGVGTRTPCRAASTTASSRLRAPSPWRTAATIGSDF